MCIFRTKSSISASASGGWWTIEVDAVVERLELAVGDERGDLDDHVAADVEAGHLEVEPDEPVVARRLGRLVTLTWATVVTANE